MSKNGSLRWIEFELPALQAERVKRSARRMGLQVEDQSMPTFRVAVTSPMEAYELGTLSAKPRHVSRSRRPR
jgi:hypothetical protein